VPTKEVTPIQRKFVERRLGLDASISREYASVLVWLAFFKNLNKVVALYFSAIISLVKK
jgi:hypothetical protein